jgi:hypothetical protein
MESSSVFTKVGDLAIPFGLLFAMNAFKKHNDKKKKTVAVSKRAAIPKKAPRVKKATKGGDCAVCNQQRGGSQEIIREELLKITEDLRNLLSI